MDKPVFSVIIPTLNEEKYLPKLLSSLVRQQFSQFEVVVVDAGSEDQTIKKAHSFKKKLSLKTLVGPRNAAAQRNLGAKRARGEYLVFFDADVKVKKNYLDKLHQQLKKIKVDFASTRGIADSDKIFDQIITYLAYLFMLISAYTKKPYMSASNIVFKKQKFLQTKGFDKLAEHCDDHELVQRAASMGMKGRVFYSIVHKFSFRRLEREGRLKVIVKYVWSSLYLLVKGPVRKSLYEYKFGGNLK